MPTYLVHTSFTQHGVYAITAKNPKEAEKKLWNGNYEKYQDDPSSVVDSQEEIIEIEKIK